ncbi:hypothetical protein TWF132_001120 [Orbilia oligospora]|nr:hypothetical protein TWF132_001120 [Orbilia oligospora]
MSNTSLDHPDPDPVLHPLEAYKIKSLPPNAYYIPSFLTPTESTTLLSQISKHPWTTLTHRRLQPHPAPLTPSGHLLTTKSLPEFLNDENNNTQTTVYKIFQEPNSLLITTDDMYTEHLHGIEAVKVDEGLTDQTVANWELLSEETRRRIVEGGGKVEREDVRISLTYRDVLKVKDAGKLFGGRALGKR